MYFGRNYYNFNGRASRREYWATTILEFFLLTLPVTFIIYLFPEYGDYIDLVYMLFTISPVFALTVRRFHDINMNPWWSLLVIPLFFLPFFKGDREDNRYGKNIY
jgi:uncharacterized membrane protein YhaH (DUF805 family)